MATCAICGQKVVFKKVLVKGFKCVCFDCVKAAGYNPFTWLGNMITTVPELRERIIKFHPEREPFLLREPEAPRGSQTEVKHIRDWWGMIPYCAICGRKVQFNKVMVKGHHYVCFDCVRAAGYNPFLWLDSWRTTAQELKERIVNLHPEREPLLPREPIPPSDEECYLERLGTEIKNMQEKNRQKRGDIGLGTMILIALLLTPFGVLSELMKDKKR